ncbi:hypothetical protein WG899_17370 [Paucibacter sp. AS339]|uniref:hypothetical protein n=1 Tax=Paucibacter hankyongi TaxID=3133434 RepID=UPI00309B2B18
MNPVRRRLLAWSLAPLVGSLGACAVSNDPAGPANPSQPKTRSYTEQVSSLLISQDQTQIVVLGERYHYLFQATTDLVRLNDFPLKPRISAKITPFHVALDGQTRGSYSLQLPADLNPDEAQQAQAFGFKPQADGSWTLDNQLSGKRYVVGNTFRAARSQTKLSHSYAVSVEAEETSGQQAVDGLVTPVTVASDGVLLIYFVALAPLLIPLIFLSREKRPSLQTAKP